MEVCSMLRNKKKISLMISLTLFSMPAFATTKKQHLSLLEGYEWEYNPAIYSEMQKQDSQILKDLIQDPLVPPVKRLRAILALQSFADNETLHFLLDMMKNSSNNTINSYILASLMGSFTKDYNKEILDIIKSKINNAKKSFIKQSLQALKKINTPEAINFLNDFLKDNPQYK